MTANKKIDFRDHCGGLAGYRNGMVFIIRTKPGVIAGTPAHWVTVARRDGKPNFSTMDHQYFHLAEAKEFCQRVADGRVNLEQLQAQYDAEDTARILDAEHDLADRIVLFRARLAAMGLSYRNLLELEALHRSLGEEAGRIMLEIELKHKYGVRCVGAQEA